MIRKYFIHSVIHLLSDDLNLIFIYYILDGGNGPYQQRKEWCKEHFLSYTVLERTLNLRKQLQVKMQKLGLNVSFYL